MKHALSRRNDETQDLVMNVILQKFRYEAPILGMEFTKSTSEYLRVLEIM